MDSNSLKVHKTPNNWKTARFIRKKQYSRNKINNSEFIDKNYTENVYLHPKLSKEWDNWDDKIDNLRHQLNVCQNQINTLINTKKNEWSVTSSNNL